MAQRERSVSPQWNRKSAFHGVNLRSAALEAEGKGFGGKSRRNLGLRIADCGSGESEGQRAKGKRSGGGFGIADFGFWIAEYHILHFGLRPC